ncbi:MAG: acylneuraminate cytidylyltransferase family protein [Candidatus Micrarchaeia archaeon]
MDKKQHILAIIPARGGSKGVPRKNIRPLVGVPLIIYSIKCALESGLFHKVYVSTEDEEIAEISKNAGAEVIKRPRELARDETPMPPVVEHAIEYYKEKNGSYPQYTFLLQPTSPLRSAKDLRASYKILSRGDCEAILGVFEADDPPQWTLIANANGFLKPLFPLAEYLARRQKLKPTYFDGPIYAFRTDAFLKYKRFLMEKTRFYVIPRFRAIDIDTEFDFKFAEFLLKSGVLNGIK